MEGRFLLSLPGAMFLVASASLPARGDELGVLSREFEYGDTVKEVVWWWWPVAWALLALNRIRRFR
jgi:hypothetical protein